MCIRRVVCLLLTGLLWLATDAAAQTAIFIVRHAERADESTDSALSAAGLQRAAALARHLEAAGITAIYTTQFQRTIKTAEPLATRLNLKMTSDATPVAELVKSLRARHPEDVVLLVGHSNTVPEMLNALGHPEKVEIGSTEFDHLFVVVPRASGPPTVLRLKY